MRLIDADAIHFCVFYLDNYHWFRAVDEDEIAEMPTIDAVPVVQYNDLRDDFAKEVYGVKNPKEQLTHDELELCRRRYVNMISEATPIY